MSLLHFGKWLLGKYATIAAFILMSMISLSTGSAQTQESLRVMSFNIRYGLANDGENHWDKRKGHVVTTIANATPDFVGTQETLAFQAAYIAERMPDYTYVGSSRTQDGNGEHCGIFFRTSRFDKLIEGHFWLSETPDQRGSKSWDSSLPRMATWLKLWDRTNKQSFYLINTHFDHRGSKARTESAKQIRSFVASLPEGSSVIVTGDFNAGVDSDPYKALFAQSDSSSVFVDTFAKLNPTAGKNDGTFNGFKGTQTGARIDWIAASREIEVITAEIDRTSFEGKYPSDHFPVTAEVRLPNPE